MNALFGSALIAAGVFMHTAPAQPPRPAGPLDVPTETYPAFDGKEVVRTGRVERVDGRIKDGESWEAGTLQYFVLVCDEGFGASANRLILRPTSTNFFESFQDWVGKRVEIRGRRAGHITFKDS